MEALTREQIQTMPAGRELDALIAEHVYGVRVVRNWPCVTEEYGELLASLGNPPKHSRYTELHPVYGAPDDPDPLPFYSTKMGHAWDLIEHMQRKRFAFSLVDSGDISGALWDARFIGHAWRGIHMDSSAPLAICRAALLATPVSSAPAVLATV